jgi:hypothetical protein
MLSSQFIHQRTLADGRETNEATAMVSTLPSHNFCYQSTYTLATPVRATSKPAKLELAHAKSDIQG